MTGQHPGATPESTTLLIIQNMWHFYPGEERLFFKHVISVCLDFKLPPVMWFGGALDI